MPVKFPPHVRPPWRYHPLCADSHNDSLSIATSLNHVILSAAKNLSSPAHARKIPSARPATMALSSSLRRQPQRLPKHRDITQPCHSERSEESLLPCPCP